MKKTIGVVLIMLATVVQGHELENADPFSDYVTTITATGPQIWHHYFSTEARLLVVYDAQQSGFQLIRRPNYPQFPQPKHVTVCEEDQDMHIGCNSQFEHVHTDAFMMGNDFGNQACQEFGPNVYPVFLAPDTFVTGSGEAAPSHHFYYDLSQGLTFDCWEVSLPDS